ncbi:hypothetical protein PCANC_25854 [Puccinia coronata f. sp. avenae]|uniref:Uncharacterized protein n=1 Tax=Puccinia coronata f. sp. avenae TaxID=200324 RepID=A0A2N5SKH9_9BASI|nr:hypothetical protein PCANC_25854 [Puccinia coronata f. sp. avenae]PLW13733.1 hypothetical protein PCASD_19671 [Puccinia coronata f. sp. avenae]PLW47433.1 hypothetical protein PCASD_04409 [Puccinia coronata f. sp. avenae]
MWLRPILLRQRVEVSCNSSDLVLEGLKRSNPSAVLQIPFWPRTTQPAVLALRAFQAEIAAIPRHATSLDIARIRYQWWRESINHCFLHSHHQDQDAAAHTSRNHPLIQALKPIIQAHKLSKYHFTRLINASEAHHLEPRFTSVSSLVSYAQSTSYGTLSHLTQVLVTSSGDKASLGGIPLATVDHALSHLSLFLTLVQLLSSMPYYIRHRTVHVVPGELLLMGCSDEQLFRFFSPPSSSSSSKYRDDEDPAVGFHAARDSLIALVHLAYAELVAAREVIQQDPAHTHRPDGTAALATHAQRIQDHIYGSGPSLPSATLHPTIMPLFLPATIARSQLHRITQIILNSHPPHPTSSSQSRPASVSHLVDEVTRKPDWSLPLKIWLDSKRCRF